MSSHTYQSPTSLDELKRMINGFRMHELQGFLAYAHENSSGKKNDVLVRALDVVVRKNTPHIAAKVKELHNKRINEMLQVPSSIPAQALNPQRQHVSSSSSSSSTRPGSYIQPSQTPTFSLSRQQQPQPVSYHSTVPADPGFYSPYVSSVAAAAPSFSNPPQVPLTPDVRFVALPFYDVMDELLKPNTLVTRTSARFQESVFNFILTPPQVMTISYQENLTPLPRYELQLRFAVMDTSCSQKDDFPSGATVRLNEKNVVLPNVIPTNKPGVEPKRPSRPVNLTPYCRASSAEPQRLHVSWGPDASKNYVVAVYYVRHVTTATLLDRLKAKPARNADYARAMIKDKLAPSDAEIALTSLRVSLQCPLGKMRMQFPTKTKNCAHLQCFDAYNYLAMNEKRPTWLCPVCDKPAPYSELAIDGYFKQVLEESGSEVSEIEVREGGVWIALMRDDDNKIIPAPAAGMKSIASAPTIYVNDISDDLPSSSKAKPVEKLRPPGTRPSVASEPPSAGGEVLIDLTLDSDDDDAETFEAALTPAAAKVASKMPALNQQTARLSSSSRSSQEASPASNSGVGLQAGSSKAASSHNHASASNSVSVVVQAPPLIELDFDSSSSPPSNHSQPTPEDPILRDVGPPSLGMPSFANVGSARDSPLGLSAMIANSNIGAQKRGSDEAQSYASIAKRSYTHHQQQNDMYNYLQQPLSPSLVNVPSSFAQSSSASSLAAYSAYRHGGLGASSSLDFPQLPTLKMSSSALSSYPAPSIMPNYGGGNSSSHSTGGSSSSRANAPISASDLSHFLAQQQQQLMLQQQQQQQLNNEPPPLRFGPSVIRQNNDNHGVDVQRRAEQFLGQMQLNAALNMISAGNSWSQQQAIATNAFGGNSALSAAYLGDIGNDLPLSQINSDLNEFLKQCINDPTASLYHNRKF